LIPRDYITEWRAEAPWVQDIQVEQDLVICRALVELFAHPTIAQALAFRGGTALYKLYIKPPARYSEDIDLVQMRAEPAGPVMEAIRAVLDPWLGAPRWKQTAGRLTFVYRFQSEDAPPIAMRRKVETNSRVHFAVHGFKKIPFKVSSRWFEGECKISTYELDELLGTKLRALYQRKKSRDLFDLATALQVTGVDPARIVETFSAYMRHGGHPITRKLYLENIHEKLSDPQFTADISPMLAGGYGWKLTEAAQLVTEKLIQLIPE
jgi:predicted nucleotidyltransferase component of viral defense system